MNRQIVGPPAYSRSRCIDMHALPSTTCGEDTSGRVPRCWAGTRVDVLAEESQKHDSGSCPRGRVPGPPEKFDDEVLKGPAPLLSPFSLENESIGYKRNRKRRKHQNDTKSSPEGLSTAPVYLTPRFWSDPRPSAIDSRVMRPKSALRDNRTSVNSLQPERFQYLLSFLDTRIKPRAISQ